MGSPRRRRANLLAPRLLLAALLPAGAVGARIYAAPAAAVGNLRAPAAAANASAANATLAAAPAPERLAERHEGGRGASGRNASQNATDLSTPVASGAPTTVHQAAAAVNATRQKSNATLNTTMPFTARVDAAVGKVFALYYSSYSAQKATTVEARGNLQPAARRKNPWLGAMMLPPPSCPLQLDSQTNYPTDLREANLRLAEMAVCNYLASRFESLPSCGASGTQVCQLELLIPLPSSDEMQEPYLGAAAALAAYSQICAEQQGNAYDAYKCNVQRAGRAIAAGLKLSGGSVTLKGLPSPGLLDLKLDDAYILKFDDVYLATESTGVYQQTQYYNNLDNVLRWQHTPPEIHFCGNLACLVSEFMPQMR